MSSQDNNLITCNDCGGKNLKRSSYQGKPKCVDCLKYYSWTRKKDPQGYYDAITRRRIANGFNSESARSLSDIEAFNIQNKSHSGLRLDQIESPEPSEPSNLEDILADMRKEQYFEMVKLQLQITELTAQNAELRIRMDGMINTMRLLMKSTDPD